MLDCLLLLRVQPGKQPLGVGQLAGLGGCDEVIEKKIHDGP